MIRFILIIIFLVIFFILSIPLYIIEWLLRKTGHMKVANKIAKVIVGNGFKFCLFVSSVKVDIKGLENIPKDQAVLFVANHRGFFDIVATYPYIPTIFGYVAKKEIMKVPGLNLWMHFINCLFIDRKNMKESLKTIIKGIEQLKSGVSVFIFPEGTRSKDGNMLPFKEGSLKMAEKANCPIIPIGIRGSGERFDDQFPKIRKGTVTIRVGNPIHIKELEAEEKKHLGAYSQKKIQELLEVIDKELEAKN
ncbi:MAG: 1-acyl-sn-glycerol-3-phosphate acyltransferase [Lachnospiraceae bacterium]|nr:1-acyl-sn-glycerol-3-phosphate acyltransferase [Lachnospiraceae bacterium]